MHNAQSGNVFVLILVAIALFGALIMTFSRTSEQGTGTISDQQARVAAQDIIAFSQAVEGAVDRLRRNTISESDLDFRHDGAYENASCGDSACRVFDAQGGKAISQSPPANANDGSNWRYTGAVRVNGIGTDGLTASNAELLMVLPNVRVETCRALNQILGVDNPDGLPPVVGGAVTYTTAFTGTFTAGSELSGATLNGKYAGCFEGNGTPATGTYHYYHVLLAR
jgi:hypothetical protein